MIPFVGRTAETARLLELWASARAGQPQVVLLSGEAGIGKTRLIDELVARVTGDGGAVLWGRCWDLGGAPAYWPWSQALGSYLDQAGTAAVVPLLSDLDPSLVRLMPRLRAALPADAVDASEATQLRLFDAVSVLLRRLSGARPLLLVLDDLESADDQSLLLLRFLSRARGTGAILVLALFRTPVPAEAPAATLLPALERDPGVHRLVLRGLSAADIASLMQAMTGKVIQAPVSHAVHARTGGNPLFASEFIRLLAASPAGPAAQLAWSPLPSGVRGVLEQRLAALPPRCRELLQACAVSGREVDLDLVAKVVGVTPEELLSALAPAQAAGVLAAVPGRPLHQAFAHLLIRDCLYESLDPAVRARLHRDLGDSLSARRAATGDEQLDVIASHYVAALAVGSAPQAITYCRLAARRAAALGARDEAVRLLELALES